MLGKCVVTLMNEGNLLNYSKVPPLRNSFRKNSMIGFLCENVLLQNRLYVPWYKKQNSKYKIISSCFS